MFLHKKEALTCLDSSGTTYDALSSVRNAKVGLDIDVLKDGGAVWNNFVEGGFIPDLEKQSLAVLRSAAKNKFDGTGKDMKRDGGIALLSGSDREAVENLFARLAEYGLFVVQSGELEFWLKNLGATGHGPQWLVSMFEKMGEDPDAAAYLRPADDDVWTFITSVRDWLSNPSRKGIPS